MKSTRRIEITAVRRRTRITGVLTPENRFGDQSVRVEREESVETSNCSLTDEQKLQIVEKIQALLPSELSCHQAESSAPSRSEERLRRKFRSSLSHWFGLFLPSSCGKYE